MADKHLRAWLVPAGVVALVTGVALAAFAQSLGDLAKLEEARRKAIKGPVKVYTNESLPQVSSDIPLPTVPVSSAPEAKPGADAGKPAVGDAAAGAGKPGGAPSAAEQEKTPEFWQKRIGDAREQRKRNEVFLSALQTRVNTLWADFTARDDPAQRAVIGAERQKALDELDRLKKEQDDLDKRIAAIEEEARKAGVPPGWIR